MIRTRFSRTGSFISTSRWRPSACAWLISCSVRVSCSRCWGRNSLVVRKLSQVRHAFGCGQVCCNGPRRVGHRRAGGLQRDQLAADVDPLLEALPLAPERLVLDRRVTGRHLRGGVIEHPLHDLHRHLVVDHPCAERVPELMRGHPRRLPGRVADVARAHPPLQALVHERAAHRPLSDRVGPPARQQQRRIEPVAATQLSLLGSDHLKQPLADRDHRLARELLVAELEIRRAGLIGRDRIEREIPRVDRPKPRLDQQHQERAHCRILEPRQVVLVVVTGPRLSVHHE
jgi:hypothetical protein